MADAPLSPSNDMHGLSRITTSKSPCSPWFYCRHPGSSPAATDSTMRAWAGFLRQQTSRWRSGARCFQSTFRGYALSVADRAKSSEVKTREAVGGRKKVSHRALPDRSTC